MLNYVSLSEASSYLGVSKATLRNWDKVGKLKAIRHPINDYRMYSLVDLRALQSQFALLKETEYISDEKLATSQLTIREVRQILARLHDVIRNTDSNSSLIVRFDELSKLLSLAIYSGSHTQTQKILTATHQPMGKYANQIRSAYKAFCRTIPVSQPQTYSKLNCSDNAIYECGKILSLVNFQDTPLDVKGLAYEEIIRRTFDKSENQQFFTPQQIVSFITDFYKDYIAGDICDPACGTGGFLAEVAKNSKKYNSLTGFEVDERLSWVAGLNIYLHNGKNFRSIHLPGCGTLGEKAEQYFNSFDLILTNPPFGSDFTDQREITKYVLGKNRISRRRGILFIERCRDLLKPNGRMAIIIDEGVLNLSHAEDVRRYLVKNFLVDAIVSLPNSAFMPYASVNSSILFLQKKENPPRNITFFGRAERVGRKANGDEDLDFSTQESVSLRSDLPSVLLGWSAGTNGSVDSPDRCYWADIKSQLDQDPDSFRLDFRFHHPSRNESIGQLEASLWPLCPLSDLCDERNISIIPTKEMNGSIILYTGLAHIESYNGIAHQVPTPANSLKSAVKQYDPGDIAFARMRPNLRKVSLMNFAEGGYLSPECVVLTPRKNEFGAFIMDPLVLSVVLRSDLVFGQLTHLIAGIGRPRLNIRDLRSIRIPVPPLKIQNRLRLDYEKAMEASKVLRTQASRFERDATNGEKLAIASLSAMLSGNGEGV